MFFEACPLRKKHSYRLENQAGHCNPLFAVRRQHLAAVVVITAAKEELRRNIVSNATNPYRELPKL